MEWRFLHPWLLLLLLVPVFLLIWEILRRKKNATVRYSDTSIFADAPVSLRVRLIPFLPWLRFLAICLMIVALARPQYGRVETQQSVLGIDISLILDISYTMDERDYHPTRLEVAKDVMTEFVDQRDNDRVNVIVFGTNPYLLVPPTFDKDSASNIITLISSSTMSRIDSRHTAIGSGLAKGVQQLKESDAKSRVAILLTDGENNAGTITPIQAAEIAKALDVRVYTIGLLSRGSYSAFSGGSRAKNINQAELQKIAEITGGKFFMASDAEALQQIYEEIDELEKTDIETIQYDNYGERFLYFLTPSLFLYGLDLLLRLLVLRRLP